MSSAFSFPTGGMGGGGGGGGGGGSVPSVVETRVADTNYTLGQAARIIPSTGGHVGVATGNTAGSSAGTIGVFNATGLAGSQAPVVTKGSTVAIPGCPDGDVLRDTNGNPVASVPGGSFTCRLGVGDGIRIEVRIGDEVQA